MNLHRLFNKYRCDKGFKHCYHEVYEKEFKPLKGEKINIFTNNGSTEFTVTGILKSQGVAGGQSFPTVIFKLETLQNLLSKKIGKQIQFFDS